MGHACSSVIATVKPGLVLGPAPRGRASMALAARRDPPERDGLTATGGAAGGPPFPLQVDLGSGGDTR